MPPIVMFCASVCPKLQDSNLPFNFFVCLMELKCTSRCAWIPVGTFSNHFDWLFVIGATKQSHHFDWIATERLDLWQFIVNSQIYRVAAGLLSKRWLGWQIKCRVQSVEHQMTIEQTLLIFLQIKSWVFVLQHFTKWVFKDLKHLLWLK